MGRHRGIGMNKPRKKKVPTPVLPEAGSEVSGGEVAPEPEPPPSPEPTRKARAAESPRKLAVRRAERLASQKQKEAAQAGKTYDKALKKYRVDKRIRETKWTALLGLPPSKELSVLDKRANKANKLEKEGLESYLGFAIARGDWLEAAFEGQRHVLLAKVATIERLKRKLHQAGIRM